MHFAVLISIFVKDWCSRMLMLYNYIFCKLKQHGVLVGNSTFHTSLLLLQLNQSSLSSSQNFFACYFLFFSSVSAPLFFVGYPQATLSSVMDMQVVMVEIWWLPLVTNTANNGSEWQVWEMYTAITTSTGERTELPPQAWMLHCGNVTANGPKSLTILNHSMSQIHQIRTNTMLQDCFWVVILVGEFLNTGDDFNWSAEIHTKNMLGELRGSWNTTNNFLLLWHLWPFKCTITTKEWAFLLM